VIAEDIQFAHGVIYPNSPAPYYNMALIYADIEKNEEKAIALLQKAIEIHPHGHQPYHKLALI